MKTAVKKGKNCNNSHKILKPKGIIRQAKEEEKAVLK